MEWYIAIGLCLGIFWRNRSIHFGYMGEDFNIMRGSTIIIGMMLWPIALLIKLFSGNLLR